MEPSKTSAKTINLGKQLIAELEQEAHADFLCQWMAHYLAEKITLAETTTGPAKAAAQKQCFEAILALWKHRSSFPNGRRPFERFEPVLNALHSLDPANKYPHYHRFKPADKDADKKEPEIVGQLINLIFATDDAARVIIQAALGELTELATTPRTKLMLQNAPKEAKADVNRAIEILIRQMEHPDPDSDLGNQMIEGQIAKLKNFKEICNILEDSLARRQQKPAVGKSKPSSKRKP